MDATAVATPGSDDNRLPAEHYFGEVLRGARVIEVVVLKKCYVRMNVFMM